MRVDTPIKSSPRYSFKPLNLTAFPASESTHKTIINMCVAIAIIGNAAIKRAVVFVTLGLLVFESYSNFLFTHGRLISHELAANCVDFRLVTSIISRRQLS